MIWYNDTIVQSRQRVAVCGVVKAAFETNGRRLVHITVQFPAIMAGTVAKKLKKGMIELQPTSRVAHEAADPHTPPERLACLAAQAPLVPLIAANPNAPSTLLLQLARSAPAAFLRNPVLPLLLLENTRFYYDLPPESMLSLMRLETLPPVLTHAIRRCPDALVSEAWRLHVAAGSKTGMDWEHHLALAFTSHPFSRDTMQELPYILDIAPPWLHALCQAHPDLHPFMTADLATYKQYNAASRYRAPIIPAPAPGKGISRDARARQRAAADEYSPRHRLERLTRDPVSKVRSAVAANRRTPPASLAHLASDRDGAVRAAVAANPGAATSVLDNLAHDILATVRVAVAGNPQAPHDMLARLAGDPIAVVRAAVTTNHNASPALLDTLVDMEAHRANFAHIAAHPHTTPRALAWLTAHADRHVLALLGKRADLTMSQRQLIYARLAAIYLDKTREAYALARMVALAAPYIPAARLDQHVFALHWLDRLALARNPHVSDDALQQLTCDGNTLVRTAAQDELIARDSGYCAVWAIDCGDTMREQRRSPISLC